MITKVQLDAAIAKSEERMEAKMNAKMEAMKENFMSQVKASSGYGVASSASESRETDEEYREMKGDIDGLRQRVNALEEILKVLVSGEEE